MIQELPGKAALSPRQRLLPWRTSATAGLPLPCTGSLASEALPGKVLPCGPADRLTNAWHGCAAPALGFAWQPPWQLSGSPHRQRLAALLGPVRAVRWTWRSPPALHTWCAPAAGAQGCLRHGAPVQQCSCRRGHLAAQLLCGGAARPGWCRRCLQAPVSAADRPPPAEPPGSLCHGAAAQPGSCRSFLQSSGSAPGQPPPAGPPGRRGRGVAARLVQKLPARLIKRT